MPIDTISGPFASGLQALLEDGEDIDLVDEIGGACCPETVFPILGPITNITYTEELKNKHGAVPRVVTFYYDENGFLVSGTYVSIKLIGNPVTLISVDHGGIAHGFVKLI